MRRLLFALVLLVAITLLAPSAYACYDCDGGYDYQGIWQSWCQENWVGRGIDCDDNHLRRVACPDPNQVGPCYERTCRLNGPCYVVDESVHRALQFGRPLRAAMVIAEVRRKVQRSSTTAMEGTGK